MTTESECATTSCSSRAIRARSAAAAIAARPSRSAASSRVRCSSASRSRWRAPMRSPRRGRERQVHRHHEPHDHPAGGGVVDVQRERNGPGEREAVADRRQAPRRVGDERVHRDERGHVGTEQILDERHLRGGEKHHGREDGRRRTPPPDERRGQRDREQHLGGAAVGQLAEQGGEREAEQDRGPEGVGRGGVAIEPGVRASEHGHSVGAPVAAGHQTWVSPASYRGLGAVAQDGTRSRSARIQRAGRAPSSSRSRSCSAGAGG